jgi:UPF0716 protein FxsA
MFAPLLFLLFIIVPIAEIYVIIQVGEAIGALPTIGLLLLDAVLGTWLLRSQGRIVWRRFRGALAAGRAPAGEAVDGGLVVVGGSLLLAPGFLTDIVGVLMLLPPTRALLRRAILRRAGSTLLGTFAAGGMPGRGRRRPPGDYDVDGTATDFDPRDPRHLHG